MVSVLLVGLGRWGANHLRNLNLLPVEVFVADVSDEQLEPARKLGIPAERLATDYRDFLDRIDAAVVVTPAQTHFQLCQELLSAEKDVFVEKPITLVADEAKVLAELADRSGLILQVGHIFRYDPASLWLRKALADGEFGKVNMIRGHFGGFKRPRTDSGVMFADGVHFVDLINFILGAVPKSVLAIHHDFLKRGMDDASLLSLEYDTRHGQTWATVETEYFTPEKHRQIVVCGEKLSAICDFNVARFKIKTFENRHVAEGRDVLAVEGAVTQTEFLPDEPLQAELRAFIDSVVSRAPPDADAWSGYESVRILNAALESASAGRAINL